MGGFEGGDEGGFWDEDSISTLVDKQNNSKLQNIQREKPSIQTSDAGYSIQVHARVNTVSFMPCLCETFTIEGCENIPLESNTIYKGYKALCEYTADSDITDFFYEYKVVVTHCMPSQEGLGGDSSDGAAFMYLLKEVCNLILSNDELAKIGSTIGADFTFLN